MKLLLVSLALGGRAMGLGGETPSDDSACESLGLFPGPCTCEEIIVEVLLANEQLDTIGDACAWEVPSRQADARLREICATTCGTTRGASQLVSGGVASRPSGREEAQRETADVLDQFMSAAMTPATAAATPRAAGTEPEENEWTDWIDSFDEEGDAGAVPPALGVEASPAPRPLRAAEEAAAEVEPAVSLAHEFTPWFGDGAPDAGSSPVCALAH